MSSDLTLPLHCGHAAPVEWAGDGSLWLTLPHKRLGLSVAGAAATIKRRRLKCAQCKRSGQRPAKPAAQGVLPLGGGA